MGRRKKAGRPPNQDPPADVKFRTTASAKARGEAEAKAEGKTLSSYCRKWFEVLIHGRDLKKRRRK